MTKDTHEKSEAELPTEEQESKPKMARKLKPKERIKALEEECEELRSKWMRAQADYQNLRRRGATDHEVGLKRALQPLLEELLLVVDFLDMALASPATTDEAKNLSMGVEMTRTKFMQALERAGVKPISTDGDFDPDLHDAAQTVENDELEPGSIVATLRRGYTWQGNVLRHAHVSVASAPGSEAEAATEPEADAEPAPQADPES